MQDTIRDVLNPYSRFLFFCLSCIVFFLPSQQHKPASRSASFYGFTKKTKTNRNQLDV